MKTLVVFVEVGLDIVKVEVDAELVDVVAELGRKFEERESLANETLLVASQVLTLTVEVDWWCRWSLWCLPSCVSAAKPSVTAKHTIVAEVGIVGGECRWRQ